MGDEFPARLKQLRQQRKAGQRALADLCGLGKSMVSKYERGEVSPTLPALLALADFFHVTLDNLTGRKGL